MTKKESKGFNFQAKHLVYLFISAMILSSGYYLGDKLINNISGKVAGFIAKPYVVAKRQKVMQSELILIEKKLNTHIVTLNELWTLKDSLATKNDINGLKKDFLILRNEVKNNIITSK